jgi:hypothetical protein
MPSFNTGMTKQEISTALSNGLTAVSGDDLTALQTLLQAEIGTNSDALEELVDSGAKNHMPTASGTGVTAGSFDCNCDIPPGDYVMFFSSLSSTHATPTTCRVAFIQANGTSYASAYIQMPQGTNTFVKFKMTATAKKFRIIPASTVSESTGTQDVVTFSGAMVCSQAAWEISHKYVPYCPTMAELYAMIQNA